MALWHQKQGVPTQPGLQGAEAASACSTTLSARKPEGNKDWLPSQKTQLTACLFCP